MNPVKRVLVAALIGSLCAIGLGEAFFGLTGLSRFDQTAFLLITAVALGITINFALESPLMGKKSFSLALPKIEYQKMLISLREHAAGFLLALILFGLYTTIGLMLNQPTIDTVDNYLDADNSTWMARIAAPGGSSLEMRGPHPFAYFIFRPLGWIFNLFTADYALSAILLNSLTGGLCVLLTWFFIKHHSGSKNHAFLMASLLGLSTAHLFFGSVVESYIFSAAALIGFALLVQQKPSSRLALILSSLLTFGITLTNFVQNLLLFVITRPKFRDILRFSALTVSLGVLLTLLHGIWYPSSKLFFLPSDAQVEDEFSNSILQQPAWRSYGRVLLLVRTLLLYSVMAPRPYVFLKEVGGEFPRFNFFKIIPGTFSLSAYEGLGNFLVLVWAGLLLVGFVYFLVDLIRSRRTDLRLAFILCLAFNFILHLNYGYEPFLYSADWTYALVFFLGMSLAPLGGNKIFQAGMTVFLLLLAYNQFLFFRFIFVTIAPYGGLGA